MSHIRQRNGGGLAKSFDFKAFDASAFEASAFEASAFDFVVNAGKPHAGLVMAGKAKKSGLPTPAFFLKANGEHASR